MNYPGRCVFMNILDFVRDDTVPREFMVLAPCFKKFSNACEESCAPCCAHQRNCPRKSDVPDGYSRACVDGPPCVLFSKSLARFAFHVLR